MSDGSIENEYWFSIAGKDRRPHDHEMRMEDYLFEKEMIDEHKKDELQSDIREILILMIHAAGMLRGFDYLEKE